MGRQHSKVTGAMTPHAAASIAGANFTAEPQVRLGGKTDEFDQETDDEYPSLTEINICIACARYPNLGPAVFSKRYRSTKLKKPSVCGDFSNSVQGYQTAKTDEFRQVTKIANFGAERKFSWSDLQDKWKRVVTGELTEEQATQEILGRHGGNRRSSQAKKDQGSPTTLKSKRGTDPEYLRQRIERDAETNPLARDVMERIDDFPSTKAAARCAGSVKQEKKGGPTNGRSRYGTRQDGREREES